MVSGFRNFFLGPYYTRIQSYRIRKNIDIANLYKNPSEYLASLSQDSDIILTVLFQDQFVIKNSLLLTLVPCYKFPSLRYSHLIDSIIRYVENWSDIVQTRICIKIVRITGFGYRKTKCLG